jgi:hypothetical protein
LRSLLLSIFALVAACSDTQSPKSSVAAGADAGAGASMAGSGGADTGAAGSQNGSAGAASAGISGQSGSSGSSGSSAATGGAAGSGGNSLAPTVPADAKLMVLGSSNELETCWRAFLWQKLQAAGLNQLDFVGDVTSGPDCGVAGYDQDLRAQSGIIVSDVPAEQFAAWFGAYPARIILMHFGGADLLSNLPIDGIIAAYTRALDEARTVTADVILLAAQHTPQDSAGCDCATTVPELNAAMATWAAQVSTAESPVIPIDLFTGFDLDTDFSDRVHLNEAGSAKVAQRFFDALTPLFEL